MTVRAVPRGRREDGEIPHFVRNDGTEVSLSTTPSGLRVTLRERLMKASISISGRTRLRPCTTKEIELPFERAPGTGGPCGAGQY